MTVQTPVRAARDAAAQAARAPTDIIFIGALTLETHIGAYEDERRHPQPLEFNLEIGTATHRAGVTDRLGDTIDYAEVVRAIGALLARERFHLLEALAERIAQLVLTQFGALWVSLAIAKRGIVPGAQRVGVAITRERHAVPGGRIAPVAGSE